MARTGRPRGFSRDDAVERALHLFWEHGYEATSLSKLREAMGGISSSSFYAIFASKEGLFRETLTLYAEQHGTCLAPLFDPDMPPRAAIEQALRASVEMQTSEDHPLGCLVCSSTMSCSPEAADVQRFVSDIRDANHVAIRCVDRGIALGELPAEIDPAALAATFNGFLLSISAQARDRISRDTLQATVSEIMRLWPVTSIVRRPVGSQSGKMPSKASSVSGRREFGSSRARNGSGSVAGSPLKPIL